MTWPPHPKWSTQSALPKSSLLLTSSALHWVATLGRAHGETAVAGQHGHLWCYMRRWFGGVEYAATEGIKGGGQEHVSA